MVSALRRGTWLDRAAIGFSLTGASLQLYFVGAVLLLVFVYNLRLLPVPRYTPLFDNPVKWASGLVLAWVALAFLFSAIYARLSRAQMLETLSEDFVRTARAKGLAKPTVYGRHALRAAITPVVTIAGLDVGGALGGTVITETTFGLQGLGRTAVDAVRSGDLPTIMATVLIAAVFMVMANVRGGPALRGHRPPGAAALSRPWPARVRWRNLSTTVTQLVVFLPYDPRDVGGSRPDETHGTWVKEVRMRPRVAAAAGGAIALVVALGACSENTGEGTTVDTDRQQTGVIATDPKDSQGPAAEVAGAARAAPSPSSGRRRSPTWTRSGRTRSPV